MSEFRKPLPTDPMDDHAEQHGHAYEEMQAIKAKLEDLPDDNYINSDKDTKLDSTVDNPYVTIKTNRPKDADGNWYDGSFGMEIDLTEGNTYKNQFVVGSTQNEFALKVLGGGGREVWVGGELSQKGGDKTNPKEENYVTRKNLNDSVEPLQENVEHNEDRINALEHELEAIADTKEAGEWRLVSVADFDISGSGEMTLTTDDLTANNNDLTLHSTDMNGVSHGFSGVEVGDLVEVVEEHTATRNVGDYGLYEVVGINGQTFTLELQQGRGIADLNKNFFIKFFHLSDDVNIAELDARYAQKSHSHNYASSSHSHSYASTSHSHDYATSSHSHSVIFRSGTSTNPSLSKGEPFLNTTYKVIYVGT